MSTKLTDQKLLKSLLYYNPESGIFYLKSKTGKILYNKQAGVILTSGYKYVWYNREKYLLHRLAFVYMLGVSPREVDHINGDKLDNRWVNLRPCTKIENSWNRKRNSNSSTGIKGLTFDKVTSRYTAKVVTNGVAYTKTISLKDKNELKVILELKIWLEETRARLHGNFTNHG